jgi:hypothetical protein
MPQFKIKYSRTYERDVEADTLELAAERAKKVCDNTTDCKLLSVVDPDFHLQPEEPTP